jgi:hypothetical protein
VPTLDPMVELEAEAGQHSVPPLGPSQDAIRALKSGTPIGTHALWATPPLQGW